MNYRLLTPATVLVSFGAALGLSSRHAGLRRTVAANERLNAAGVSSPASVAVAVRSVTARIGDTPSAVATTAAPPQAPPVSVAQDVEPPAQARESEGFLYARDRAAEHSARSH